MSPWQVSGEMAARGSAPRRGRRRALRVGALGLLLVQLAGCYQYVPVAAPQVPAGARVSMQLTDRGRVEFADRIGPGIRKLNGTVVSATDTALTVSVNEVEFIDVAVPVKWNGDRILFSQGFLGQVRERRLSKSRSWLMAGVVALGVAAMSTIAISGFGIGGDSDKSGSGNTHQ